MWTVDVFAMLIKNSHHQTQPDYLGPGPENCHDFHKVIDLLGLFPDCNKALDLIACSSKQLAGGRSTEILSSFEEYSPANAGRKLGMISQFRQDR